MVNRTKVMVVTVVLAAVLALAWGAVTFAAGPNDPTPTPTPTVCPGCGGGYGWGGDNFDVVSKLTGLTAAQIQEQRQAGKSLVQIVATKNVTEKQLVDALLADRKADLNKAVTAGTLTQDRANLMLQQMQQSIAAAVNRTTIGPPAGRGMGFGQGGCGAGFGGRGGMMGCGAIR